MAVMSGPFDLIFLDIEKEDCLRVLPYCLRLLKVWGLMVNDNVGFQGAAEFNRVLITHHYCRTVNLLALLPRHSPEKDGLSLALRVK